MQNGLLWTIAYEVTLHYILMSIPAAFEKRTKTVILAVLILLRVCFFVWHNPVTFLHQSLEI